MSSVILGMLLLTNGIMAFANWAMYSELTRKIDVLNKKMCKTAETMARTENILAAALESEKEDE